MTYPNFGIRTGPQSNVQDDVRIKRSSNGTLRARIMWSAAKREFQFSHILEKADLLTFRSFYAANRGQSFDFLWTPDGQVYSCMFVDTPRERHYGGTLWEVQVKLAETA